MKPYRILIISDGKTKWLDLEGEGLEAGLEAMLQYLYDSISNLQDFEVWLCYPRCIDKFPLLNIIDLLHIKKRDCYQRLKGIYTGKHFNFELLKRCESMDMIKDVLKAIKQDCEATESCSYCPFNISNNYHDFCMFKGILSYEGITPENWELDKIKWDEGGVHGQ